MTQLAVSAGAPWTRVIFTTYALSLTFFETVVMDALIRGGTRDVLILSDIEGVKCSLSEKGVRGVGRDYRLEPVAMRDREAVFHPKIGAFVSDTEAFLTVGSGNLTFGGWANNLEMIEFLHPSFAASAFGDVAQLFELFASEPRMRHHAAESCEEMAADLRRSVMGQRDRGDLRVLHGLTRSIGAQLEDFTAELGGATRLAVASPYFDDGTGVSSFAQRLGLEEILVHRHDTTATGTAPNWPRRGPAHIKAVTLDMLRDDERPLHAKAFEIVCRKGRLIVAGSANATNRALGDNGNVEAVTVRILRRGASWGWMPAEPPPVKIRTPDAGADETEAIGVLRAQLDGSLLTGWVLSPVMMGPARLEQVTSLGADTLGTVTIDSSGTFRLETPGLEMQAWNAGRLVLRVSNPAGVAEGYASSAAATTVGRRVGAMAPRLFAFLAGSDTPEDVAALFDWISRDPERLCGMMNGPASREPRAEREAVLLDSNDLVWIPQTAGQNGGEHREAQIMARLVEQLRRALRAPKATYELPLGDGDDAPEGPPDDADNAQRKRHHEAAVARSQTLTSEFLDWALDTSQVEVWGVFALELLNHMAQRLGWPPTQVIKWLERIAGALTPQGVSEDDRPLVVGSLLALAGRLNPAIVRAHLIRLHIPMDGGAPDPSAAPLFAQAGGADMVSAWKEVGQTRSVEEVVAEFVRALRDPATSQVEDLQESPLKDWCPEEWPLLITALTNPKARGKVQFGTRRQTACPRCYSVLPSTQSEKYRTRLVATAKNCGHGVIIFGGDAS